ncbi:MAG: hypothetical protein ABEJ76_08865 [Halanaeroarchaeum sp.]
MSGLAPVATDQDRETYPAIADRIGEDPARYLDRDLLTPASDDVQDDLFAARLSGIDRLEVIEAWIEVETRLQRGPRQHVLARLNQRKRYLEEHGERDLPGRSPDDLRALADADDGAADEEPTVWRHEACGSTDVERESDMAWFCHECEQRTNRVEAVEEAS